MQNKITPMKVVQEDRSISIPRFTPRFKAVHGSIWPRRGQQAIAGLLALGILPLSAGAAWGQDNGQQQGYGNQQGYGQQQAPPPPPPDSGAQQGYGQQQGYGNQQGAPPPADEGGPQGPPPSDYQALSPEQIDQLVAPIALYPDSLVAQVLAAATYPAQVASAQQFLNQNGNAAPEQLAQMANGQPWDPSVKALVAFPQVVNDLNRNMNWTTQLGNAYYNQPQDVLGAVQTMRQRAYAAGNLRSTPQLSVAYNPGDIVIAPVSPAVVYVPYYNPWAVYGAPLPAYRGYYWGPPRGISFGAGLAIGFGAGFAIGAFTHFGWGFHSWAPNWGSRTVVFNHTTFISHSTTVINHGYYGRFDRSPSARVFNSRAQATAPRPGTSAFRNGNQQQRIGQGVNSGSLTSRESGNLEQRESSIHNEKSNMRATDGGRLTRQDRRDINQRQNHVSHAINRDKHNGRVR